MQEIQGKVFIGTKEWKFWEFGTCGRDKYINVKNINIPKEATFCNQYFSKGGTVSNVNVISRLGSPSADGEVYHIRYNGNDFAMKIMPFVDKDSKERNRHELDIANRASNLVLTGQCPYFPIVFAYGHCDHVYLYSEQSPFIDRAMEYHCYSNLAQQLKGIPLKRFNNDYGTGVPIEEIVNKYKLDDSICNKGEIVADFLISELANGDLGNWMNTNHSLFEWKNIMINVISGMYHLNTLIGVYHSDLHPGNILILDTTDKCDHPIALIHDFGRAAEITDPQHVKAGMIFFFKEFLGTLNLEGISAPPVEITSLCQKMYKFVQDYPLEDI